MMMMMRVVVLVVVVVIGHRDTALELIAVHFAEIQNWGSC